MYLENRRKARETNGRKPKVSPGDSKRFPALVEYLTLDKWKDGSARQTATLYIVVDQGQIKVCINDRDEDKNAWTSVSSLETLLDELEKLLEDDHLEWRDKPKWQRKK